MIDDATVYRLGQDNFRFVGGDEYDGIWLNELREKLDLKVWVKPSTDQLHNVAVQGPESRELLKKIVWTPPTQTSLEDLKWFRFTIGRIGTYDGIPIVVSRTGYTGELGYEVWCHPPTGRRCGTRSGRPARSTASRRSASRRSTSSASSRG